MRNSGQASTDAESDFDANSDELANESDDEFDDIKYLSNSLLATMQECSRDLISSTEFQRVQNEITVQTRFAVIDWISRVADKLQYSRETLFNSVFLLDHVLAKISVSKKDIQLYTATCLWMSTKMIETKNRNLEIYIRVCHDENSEPKYQQDDFTSTEIRITQIVDGRIEYSTPQVFIQALLIDMDLAECTIYTNFFLDISLTSNDFIEVPPHIIAAAALILGASGIKKHVNCYTLLRLIHVKNPSYMFSIANKLSNLARIVVGQVKGRNFAVYSDIVAIPLIDVVKNASEYLQTCGSLNDLLEN